MIYEFQATQDLHGYDKPWAPGTTANIITEAIKATLASTSEGGVSGYRYRDLVGTCALFPAESGKTYIRKLKTISWNNRNVWVTGEGDGPVYDTFYPGGATNTNTYVAENTGFGVQFTLNAAYDPEGLKNNLMIHEEDYDGPFIPYENICMPEGFNIWDPTNQEYVQVYAGYVNANTRELYLRPVYEEYAGEELVGPWMSSLDPYSEDTTPTEGAFVIDFGGELTSLEITPFMLQTLLDSLGIRQHFTDGAGLLNKLMDQAQGRVRSEEELLHLSRPLNVIAIGDQLPAGITFKPISKDVLPGLPGKFIR